MAPIKQRTLWPSQLNEVASAQATQGNAVAAVAIPKAITLADVVNTAAGRLGLQHDAIGSIFGGISVAEVSKCFGPNNPDRNRLMKQPLPMPLAREIALAMCEATGLAIAGPDAERHALGDLLTACANYIRVVQR